MTISTTSHTTTHSITTTSSSNHHPDDNNNNNISPSETLVVDMTSLEEPSTTTPAVVVSPSRHSASTASPAASLVEDNDDDNLTAPASLDGPGETIEPKKTSNAQDETDTEEEVEDGAADKVVIDKCATKRDSDVQDNKTIKPDTKAEKAEEEEEEDKCNRVVKRSAVSHVDEISSGDVAEMARLRAAKFIQERTKMACLLPSAAEAESAKQSNSMSSSHLGHSTSASSGSSSSRKRKLTVKDILVSQRTRDSKQQRLMGEPAPAAPPAPTINHDLGALGQLMPGLGAAAGLLDANAALNEANPLAALLAAAAAAAASNAPSNGSANLAQAFMPDTQSSYISNLSNSNANPTTTLALMASLSAMMQQQQQHNNTKEENIPLNVISSLSQLTSNPLINLESTLANVMANNFSRNSNTVSSNNAEDDDDDEEDEDKRERTTSTPLDFSLKTVTNKSNDEKGSKKLKKKKINGENGGGEDETPLDLSAKRPEEMEHSNKESSSIFSQMANLEGAGAGNNFAAMAAAAAAFSPNLLTKMAASMSPWSNFAAHKPTNESNATAAAFAALLQQVYATSNTNGNKPLNAKSAHSSPQTPSVSALFQSFPDLYWNKQFQAKTSNSGAPSFGGLSNSAASLSARHHNHQPPPAASQPMRTKSSSGRQNPWQAQWINRSSEQTRDVFTCVWCKDSFKSLAEMTDHMKRSPRCGMAGMQQHHSHTHHPQQAQHSSSGSSAHSPASSGGGGGHHPHHHHHHHHQSPTAPTNSSLSSSPFSQQAQSASSAKLTNLGVATSKESGSAASGHHNGNNFHGSSSSSSKPSGGSAAGGGGGVTMPRKLVRGQDVWLGRGAEQTRQILKCMWCGQSFKSLADMTQHMKVTQHYTNIISQEQITSWKQTDDKLGDQSQLNAVLTCKICDEAFGSLKELSSHMMKNNHFKEAPINQDSSGASTPVLQQSTPNSHKESRSPVAPATTTTSSDRRKKSLPVRKLLEIERNTDGMVTSKKGDDDETDSQHSTKSVQLIECEDCHEKVEPRCYLQHIKQCRHRNGNKSDAESDRDKAESDKGTGGHGDNGDSESKNDNDSNSDKKDNNNGSSNQSKDANESERKESNAADGKTNSAAKEGEEGASSSGSVLNALEKLIEKNFDSKSRRTQQTGILQRLGIDEEVFPPWQNMTPNATITPWALLNNGHNEFSRSNSSSSTNSRINALGQVVPQLRYRRNSSNSQRHLKNNTESNCSFSSQETEEEESGDESNSDYGQKPLKKRGRMHQRDKSARLNFPISSMLSSPLPGRPTSASSTASSISPSDVHGAMVAEHLNRMTPSSHRSALEDDEDDDDDDDDDEDDFTSPMALCKKTFEEGGEFKKAKTNGEDEGGKPSHHPLLQLQKLLDKTDTSNNRSKSSTNPRLSSPFAWQDSSSAKGISPASSPMTPPIAMQHSPSSASVKSDDGSYLLLKCAFCDTHIASHNAYRSHLAKVHLQMREPIDMISNEELVLLVLAKSSNLQFGFNNNHATSQPKPPRKESKRKSSKADNWEMKSPSNPIVSSPTQAPAIESSQSKFLKYTELAKQLSSKYG